MGEGLESVPASYHMLDVGAALFQAEVAQLLALLAAPPEPPEPELSEEELPVNGSVLWLKSANRHLPFMTKDLRLQADNFPSQRIRLNNDLDSLIGQTKLLQVGRALRKDGLGSVLKGRIRAGVGSANAVKPVFDARDNGAVTVKD